MNATCPVCAGLGSILGRLGALIWYRCRSCGSDFNCGHGEATFETLNSEAVEQWPLPPKGSAG